MLRSKSHDSLIRNSYSLLCVILNDLLRSDLEFISLVHLLSEHLLSILELGGRDSKRCLPLLDVFHLVPNMEKFGFADSG